MRSLIDLIKLSVAAPIQLYSYIIMERQMDLRRGNQHLVDILACTPSIETVTNHFYCRVLQENEVRSIRFSMSFRIAINKVQRELIIPAQGELMFPWASQAYWLTASPFVLSLQPRYNRIGILSSSINALQCGGKKTLTYVIRGVNQVLFWARSEPSHIAYWDADVMEAIHLQYSIWWKILLSGYWMRCSSSLLWFNKAYLLGHFGIVTMFLHITLFYVLYFGFPRYHWHEGPRLISEVLLGTRSRDLSQEVSA